MDGSKITRIYSKASLVSFILCLCSLTFLSCLNEDNPKLIKTESIELYEMIEVNGEYKQGKLMHAESFVYDQDGHKVDHKMRQSDNSLHQEKYIYEDDVLKMSTYYDAQNELLSYYNYQYDNDKLTQKKSFEAATEELLRIDDYEYSASGQLIKQYIKTAAGDVNRTMAFSYDKHGNETQVTIRDADGEIIINEEFKITEYDVNKRWLERWSFNNDTPLTLRKRVFEYY